MFFAYCIVKFINPFVDVFHGEINANSYPKHIYSICLSCNLKYLIGLSILIRFDHRLGNRRVRSEFRGEFIQKREVVLSKKILFYKIKITEGYTNGSIKET